MENNQRLREELTQLKAQYAELHEHHIRIANTFAPIMQDPELLEQLSALIN